MTALIDSSGRLPADRSASLPPHTRVAFVLSLPYPRTAGGAERWVSEAAAALRTHVTVTEHYLDPDSLVSSTATVRGHAALRPRGREGDRLALAPGLLSAVGDADVVHVHQYGSVMAQALAVVARLRGQPVFMTDHGSSGFALGRRLRLTRLFDGYLCPSAFAAAQIPSAQTRVVYGGVSTDRFAPGRRSEEPFALYVGRLLPHKGIDWLIRSLPPGGRLIIAGRPDEAHAPGYLSLLRREATGRDVGFCLDADDAEVARLYQSAWVTVLPSVWRDLYGRTRAVPELLGLSLLESMACGTPVIASRLGPLGEVVDPASGVLVEPGDERGLRGALGSLLGDREQVELRGRAARERVLTTFTWSQVARRCTAAYSELGRTRSP